MSVTIEYSIDSSQLRVATDAERISTVGRVLKAAREKIRLSVRALGRGEERRRQALGALADATKAHKRDGRILIDGDMCYTARNSLAPLS